jgi:hypothetical protein
MSDDWNGDDVARCVWAITDPQMSTNPVAWFTLHKEGITREVMQEMVTEGQWQGPPPVFKNAPAYDSGMWLYMVAEADGKS